MILLIDGKNQAYISNSVATLTADDGFPTQAIYGFIDSIYHYLEKFSPVKKIITAFDDGRSPKRLAIYPEYKKRPLKDDFKISQLFEQLPIIESMLLDFGIDTIKMKNTEADDIIAFLALYYSDLEDEEVVIISSDKDFYQLINKNISIYSASSRSKIRYLNSSNFKRVHKILPEQWLDFRAMTGDQSDNIPGIPGVGEKTALEILQNFGSYSTFSELVYTGKHIPNNKIERKAYKHDTDFNLAKRLMDLRSHEMIENPLEIMSSIDHGHIRARKIYKLLERYSINSMIEKFDILIEMLPKK